MMHVVIVKEPKGPNDFTKQTYAALKYDNNQLMMIGPADFIEDWEPYFANKEGEWWMEYRFEESPFSRFRDITWRIAPEDEAPSLFAEAMSNLPGAKVKVIDYPGGS